MFLLSLGLARSDGRKINEEPWESCISDASIWKIRCRAFILSKSALSQWYDETVKMTVEPTVHLRVVGSPAQGIGDL